MNPLTKILLLCSIICLTVDAAPTVSFPFNAQLPPVARIGSLYAYSFSPHTFRSDLNITYSLVNNPAWLSLESSERRLYGVPQDKDVPPGEIVGQDFQIIATDESGSTTLDATIVISREQGPVIRIPISEQVKSFGDYSAPASILTYPSTDFKYTFDQNTFKHEPGMINYYASSGNSSPLPAWIRFDAPSLSFEGRTPGADALFQPPQRFDVRLVASDIEGFSSTSIEFAIVVSSHKLTADEPVIVINASRGESFEYDGLKDGIQLDGKTVSPGDLDVSPANLPGWMRFDDESWVIQGKPENDDHSTNFTIRFTDGFSDTLEVWGMVNVASGLFETTFHDVEATPGEDFSMDLSDHFKDPDDIKVELDTEPDQDWLKLDGLRLKGKVPKSSKGELDIAIRATSKSSGESETETLTMSFLAPDGSTTMTSTTSGPSSTSTDDSGKDEKDEGNGDGSDGDADKDESNSDDDMSTSIILLATIIPILIIALLIILIACLIRRRRSRRTYLTNKKFRTKISHPVPDSLRVNGSAADAKGVHSEKAPQFAGYAEAGSRSSHSSDTLGSLSSRDLSAMYMHNAGRGHSFGTSDTGGGESWFTMDRTPTGLRSEETRSRGSEITVPYSTHQLLPTPPFLAQTGEGFRSGLDLTIPSLDDLPSLQETPARPERSTGFYSTITTSSAALPSSPKFLPATSTTIINRPSPLSRPSTSDGRSKSKSTSSKDWSTIREDESVPSMPPPPTRLSSLLRRGPQSGRDSTFSQASFASSENWRVIGHHGRSAPNLSSYNEIVESSPWHPNARDTKGESSNLGASSHLDPSKGQVKVETMVQEQKPDSVKDGAPGESEVRWVRPSVSTSRYSKLNESTSKGSGGWKSESSRGKGSEGSFKVFI